MEQVIIIGIDLAKNSFQLHGARGRVGCVPQEGEPGEAAGLRGRAARAARWRRVAARIIGAGRSAVSATTVRLTPPVYVKPYVKRQQNDAADAEAICEAASRPTMRFVAVKTEEQSPQIALAHLR